MGSFTNFTPFDILNLIGGVFGLAGSGYQNQQADATNTAITDIITNLAGQQGQFGQDLLGYLDQNTAAGLNYLGNFATGNRNNLLGVAEFLRSGALPAMTNPSGGTNIADLIGAATGGRQGTPAATTAPEVSTAADQIHWGNFDSYKNWLGSAEQKTLERDNPGADETMLTRLAYERWGDQAQAQGATDRYVQSQTPAVRNVDTTPSKYRAAPTAANAQKTVNYLADRAGLTSEGPNEDQISGWLSGYTGRFNEAMGLLDKLGVQAGADINKGYANLQTQTNANLRQRGLEDSSAQATYGKSVEGERTAAQNRLSEYLTGQKVAVGSELSGDYLNNMANALMGVSNFDTQSAANISNQYQQNWQSYIPIAQNFMDTSRQIQMLAMPQQAQYQNPYDALQAFFYNMAGGAQARSSLTGLQNSQGQMGQNAMYSGLSQVGGQLAGQFAGAGANSLFGSGASAASSASSAPIAGINAAQPNGNVMSSTWFM